MHFLLSCFNLHLVDFPTTTTILFKHTFSYQKKNKNKRIYIRILIAFYVYLRANLGFLFIHNNGTVFVHLSLCCATTTATMIKTDQQRLDNRKKDHAKHIFRRWLLAKKKMDESEGRWKTAFYKLKVLPFTFCSSIFSRKFLVVWIFVPLAIISYYFFIQMLWRKNAHSDSLYCHCARRNVNSFCHKHNPK